MGTLEDLRELVQRTEEPTTMDGRIEMMDLLIERVDKWGASGCPGYVVPPTLQRFREAALVVREQPGSDACLTLLDELEATYDAWEADGCPVGGEQ